MSLTVPWVPSLKGNVLPPCARIADEIEENTVPFSSDALHKPWAKKTLLPWLDLHPDSKEAMWETTCALWRLRKYEEALGARGDVLTRYIASTLQVLGLKN